MTAQEHPGAAPDPADLRAEAAAWARAAAGTDAEALASAVRQEAARPTLVAVVGPPRVGRTTLASRLAGRPPARGTPDDRPRALVGDGLIALDTPGWQPETAGDLLKAVRAADAVVWLTDALRPLALEERRALAALRLHLGEAHVVAGRADLLEPADRSDAAARLAHLAPRALLLDARSPPAALRAAVLHDAGPARRHRLADALREAAVRLGAPAPHGDARAAERRAHLATHGPAVLRAATEGDDALREAVRALAAGLHLSRAAVPAPPEFPQATPWLPAAGARSDARRRAASSWLVAVAEAVHTEEGAGHALPDRECERARAALGQWAAALADRAAR